MLFTSWRTAKARNQYGQNLYQCVVIFFKACLAIVHMAWNFQRVSRSNLYMQMVSYGWDSHHGKHQTTLK